MLHLKLSVILDDAPYMRTCAYRTNVRACARIKNILRFLDPPTSVLIKYLVIRRKVRPLVYSSHNVGRHISLIYPSLFVFSFFSFHRSLLLLP